MDSSLLVKGMSLLALVGGIIARIMDWSGPNAEQKHALNKEYLATETMRIATALLEFLYGVFIYAAGFLEDLPAYGKTIASLPKTLVSCCQYYIMCCGANQPNPEHVELERPAVPYRTDPLTRPVREGTTVMCEAMHSLFFTASSELPQEPIQELLKAVVKNDTSVPNP